MSIWQTLIGALISIVSSVFPMFFDKELRKKKYALIEKQLELTSRQIEEYDERKRLDGQPDIIAENKIEGDGRCFIIKNVGKVPAYNIMFAPTGITGKKEFIWYDFLQTTFPIKVLNGGCCFTHKYTMRGIPFPSTTTILLWESENGNKYKRTIVMDL